MLSHVLSACGSTDSHVRARACTPGCMLLPRVTGYRHMQCPAASLRHARINDPLRSGRRHQLSPAAPCMQRAVHRLGTARACVGTNKLAV